jgi:hypothetical protein
MFTDAAWEEKWSVNLEFLYLLTDYTKFVIRFTDSDFFLFYINCNGVGFYHIHNNEGELLPVRSNLSTRTTSEEPGIQRYINVRENRKGKQSRMATLGKFLYLLTDYTKFVIRFTDSDFTPLVSSNSSCLLFLSFLCWNIILTI